MKKKIIWTYTDIHKKILLEKLSLKHIEFQLHTSQGNPPITNKIINMNSHTVMQMYVF